MITWVQVLPLPLTSCVALSESLNNPLPQFPHSGTYFTGLSEGLDVLHNVSLMMEKKWEGSSRKQDWKGILRGGKARQVIEIPAQFGLSEWGIYCLSQWPRKVKQCCGPGFSLPSLATPSGLMSFSQALSTTLSSWLQAAAGTIALQDEFSGK